MTKIVFQAGAGTTIKGLTDHVRYDIVEVPDVTGESRAANTLYDCEYDLVTPSASKNNFRMVPNNIGYAAYSLRSSDEAIATIDGNKVVWAGHGDVDIFIRANGCCLTNHTSGFGEKKYSRTMSDSATEDFIEVEDYATGSLARHIWDQTTALISGLSPGDTAQKAFSVNNYNVSSPSVTINPNLFCGGLDISGIPVMSSRHSDDRYAICPVTLRHGLVAKHVTGAPYWQVGDTVVWRLPGGTFFEAVISDITPVTRDFSHEGGPTITATPDLSVVYFDRDLTGVTTYKTMALGDPDKYLRSFAQDEQFAFPGPYLWGKVPCIRKAMHAVDEGWQSCYQINHVQNFANAGNTEVSYGIGNMDAINNIGESFDQPITVTEGTDGWGITAIPGDSGSPSFLLINGELVLICSQWMSGVSSHISFYTDEINDIMDTQASAAPGTWTLTHVNLSGFTDYS